jgi:hypothetical protein
VLTIPSAPRQLAEAPSASMQRCRRCISGCTTCCNHIEESGRRKNILDGGFPQCQRELVRKKSCLRQAFGTRIARRRQCYLDEGLSGVAKLHHRLRWTTSQLLLVMCPLIVASLTKVSRRLPPKLQLRSKESRLHIVSSGRENEQGQTGLFPSRRVIYLLHTYSSRPPTNPAGGR